MPTFAPPTPPVLVPPADPFAPPPEPEPEPKAVADEKKDGPPDAESHAPEETSPAEPGM